jgi:FlaG/FlaF family flagellin (archaellin)
MTDKNDFGVSSVIGTILMIAVTISVASIIFMSFSMDGAESSTSWSTNSITIVNAANGFIVSDCGQNVLWDDFSIKTDHTDTTISINSEKSFPVGTNWTKINTTNFDISGFVTAGDYFIVDGVEDSEYIKVYFRNDPANVLQGPWIVKV